jgi:hypothetical protein
MSNSEQPTSPIEVSWTKVNGDWLVRVYGTSDDLSGQLVTVTTKDGKASPVLLGNMIEERGSAVRIYSTGDRQ